MEYIILLEGIVALIATGLIFNLTVDYYKLSRKVKDLIIIQKEKIAELEFKMKLRKAEENKNV